MKRLSVLLFCLGILCGCKGPKGDTGSGGGVGSPGPAGPQGPAGPGAIQEFTGTFFSSSPIIYIGLFPARTNVSIYWAFASLPSVWSELGQPTGSGSVTYSPWASWDQGLGAVYVYNVTVGDRYKIVVISPS